MAAADSSLIAVHGSGYWKWIASVDSREILLPPTSKSIVPPIDSSAIHQTLILDGYLTS